MEKLTVGMISFAQRVIDRYRDAWANRIFRTTVFVSILLFALAVTANLLGGMYATERASNAVTDIILSNTPVFDVDFIYVYGAILFVVLSTTMVLLNPRTIPFTLGALALFWLIRAIFISLTHIGPYPDHAILDTQSRLLLIIFGGGDEFFSAHTGLPFLLALIYWDRKGLRYFFLSSSIFFAIIVLLGHLHYTIDVLSAFFITYTIYQIALYFFPRERALFLGIEEPVPLERSLITVALDATSK